jgi:hypothetical protein
METGRVLLVILEQGGIAGLGARYIAIPPAEFVRDADDDDEYRINQTAETLQSAPQIDVAKWDEALGAERLAAIYQHYGVAPDQMPFKTTVRSARPQTDSEDKESARQKTYHDPSMARIGSVERASKVIGATIRNLAEEKLGTVDELLVNLKEGRVVTAVVATGGFLGVGDEKTLVPPMALQWDPSGEQVHLDASRDKLRSAPRYDEDALNDPAAVVGVYRLFGFEQHLNYAADNTAQNRVDRGGETVTPLDQGNNDADVKVTAEIRRALIARDDLSVNAKNVKVITIDGKVTLRGAVNSEQEKATIEDIANNIAGSENVENELQVKRSLSRN